MPVERHGSARPANISLTSAHVPPIRMGCPMTGPGETTMAKMDCPRCDGTGFHPCGVCYRCNGAGRVNRIAPRKAKPALVETPEAKEARLRASMGDADYEIVFNGRTLDEVEAMGLGRK